MLPTPITCAVRKKQIACATPTNITCRQKSGHANLYRTCCPLQRGPIPSLTGHIFLDITRFGRNIPSRVCDHSREMQGIVPTLACGRRIRTCVCEFQIVQHCVFCTPNALFMYVNTRGRNKCFWQCSIVIGCRVRLESCSLAQLCACSNKRSALEWWKRGKIVINNKYSVGHVTDVHLSLLQITHEIIRLMSRIP